MDKLVEREAFADSVSTELKYKSSFNVSFR